MRFLFFCSLLAFIFSCFRSGAQQSHADSLKEAIAQTADSPQKVEILCDLAYYLVDIDDQGAVAYANQAKELATKLKYNTGIKSALTILGLSKIALGEHQVAMSLLQESKHMKGTQRADMESYNLMLIGSVHRDWANFDSAVYYYQKAIKTIGEQGDPYYLGSIYRALATVKVKLWQNHEAIELLKKAEDYARKKPRDYNVLMNIWMLYGDVYQQLMDFEKSKFYYAKMCDQETHSPDYLVRIKCLLVDADKHMRNGDYEKALNIALQAIDMSDTHRYPLQRLEVLQKIGAIYNELSQFTLASQYFFDGLKIAESLGLREETAQLYGYLAWVAKDQMNLELATDYVRKSISISTEIGNAHGAAVAQNTQGLILYLQHKYDESLSVFEKSMKVAKEIGNAGNISATIFNSAMVYEAMGNYEKAYKLQQESLKIDEKSNDLTGLSISYNAIAALSVKLKKYSDAEIYLRKALSITLRIGNKALRKNVYLIYARLYQATGNNQRSVYFYNRYVELSDSIFLLGNATKLAELQALYQVERKESEIKLINQQKKNQEQELEAQLTQARQQRWIIAISSAAILLLLTAVVIGYRYLRAKNRSHKVLEKLNREITEQKEEIMAQSEELMEASETIGNINKQLENKIEARTAELKQAYKELDTFFYRSSHDFRRPITTFLGLAGVAKITVKDATSLELFEKVSETATNLDKMLHKLQSISDVGSQQMVYKEVLIKALVDDVLNGFKKLIEEKKIAVTVSIEEEIPLVSYPAMMIIIIENLVENAILFCSAPDPIMNIRILVNSEHAEIRVADNGQGIMEAYKSRVFDMYFRANENSKGNGLGLYITKKAVEKLDGHINVESEHAKGSVFTVTLPNRK